MWHFWKKKKNKWTNKKMAFVSILIATSVAFVLIFTKIIPIASLPSFKIMFGGLPVKLTGYIFGPIIGAITGIVADLISFIMVPTYIHWLYTLAFSIAGLIPGLVGYFMNKKWENKHLVDAQRKEKISNINFFITIFVLVFIFIFIFTLVYLQDDSFFVNQKLIKNKWIFLAISTSGLLSMLLFTIIARFSLNTLFINSILPIIVFSALLELINTPIISLGDKEVWNLQNGFLTILTGHLLLSPIKIWGNMIIILFSYNIVSPLIYNKTENGWN